MKFNIYTSTVQRLKYIFFLQLQQQQITKYIFIEISVAQVKT